MLLLNGESILFIYESVAIETLRRIVEELDDLVPRNDPGFRHNCN